MSRFRSAAVTFIVVILMTLATAGNSSAQGPMPHRWEESERQELLRYARDTWHSFELMARPDGLPLDTLCRDEKGDWERSKTTSPANIAAYLWATLAAEKLGIIDGEVAERRLGATLTTLARLERSHGFFYTQYGVDSGVDFGVSSNKGRPNRSFLSTVDNAWLAVGLVMIGNTRPALREEAEALLTPMDFGFFYAPHDPERPSDRPGQLHGGYYTDDGSFTTFYGMLNTEPRIASYLAIARKQVPPEHYYRLYRTFPTDRGAQTQTPAGEVRNYGGLPVFEGHYTFHGLRIVPSWGGSMFEALMVPLFVPEEAWAPKSWGINHPLYVRAQIRQGLEIQRYGSWGFSPCRTPEGGYENYGVDGLGSEINGYLTHEPEKATTKGPPRPNGVVTPHASFLALRYAPREALDNLRSLTAKYPIYCPCGFHDSVNVATGKVSRCVLSLDQGMILVAIANALADDAMRKAFCDGPIEAAIRPLIAPEEFTAGPAIKTIP